MRRHVKPNSNIIHSGTSSGNKTDFYEDNGSLDKNRGYSVKSTKMPDATKQGTTIRKYAGT